MTDVTKENGPPKVLAEHTPPASTSRSPTGEGVAVFVLRGGGYKASGVVALAVMQVCSVAGVAAAWGKGKPGAAVLMGIVVVLLASGMVRWIRAGAGRPLGW